MEKEINKHLLNLHKLGLIKPFIRISPAVRKKILRNANFNIGLIPNQLTYLDLLTDSLMHFILCQKKLGSKSRIEAAYLNLNNTFKRYFGYKYVLPVAQGRMAEALFAKLMARNAHVIPSNGLFITTRLHQELNGATVLEIPIKDAYDLNSDFAFKGNMDTGKLEEIILEYGLDWIPYIYVEMCVNATGGHPVSIGNLREINHIAKAHKIPLILDACRILENAYLIKKREKGYDRKSVSDIVKEICSLSDGCTMSTSKDFFVENGAFFATNNQELYYQAQDAISVFGDGLSVRAKAELSIVLSETFNQESWVRERIDKVHYLWKKLKEFGLPVVSPSGGHAVFLDAEELYKILPSECFPEKAFLVFLYLISGIRAGENMLTSEQKKQGVKMIRLAIPTRMYSFRKMNYIARSLKYAWANKEKITGLKKIYQPPSLSGAFVAEYELIGF